jgi:hypothetical protein
MRIKHEAFHLFSVDRFVETGIPNNDKNSQRRQVIRLNSESPCWHYRGFHKEAPNWKLRIGAANINTIL